MNTTIPTPCLAVNDEEAALAVTVQCSTGDNEYNHGKADELLCDLLTLLGYTKTVEAFKAVEKWYA